MLESKRIFHVFSPQNQEIIWILIKKYECCNRRSHGKKRQARQKGMQGLLFIPAIQNHTKLSQHFLDHLTINESAFLIFFSFPSINYLKTSIKSLNLFIYGFKQISIEFLQCLIQIINGMRTLYRACQIRKLSCFGKTIFARQIFEICNLSGKPYQIQCLFPPKHLSNSGLLPSRLLADILTKDYTKQPSHPIEVELRKMQARITKMQSIDLNSQQLHYHLGICLLLLQKYEEASQSLGKAWLLNKSDPNYCIQIAVCLMESGNYFDAIKLLERQLRDNPTSSNLHHHLAIAYFNIQNYREAIFNFYKNYQINQELSIDFISQGEEQFKGSKYVEALPFYLKRVIHQQRDEKVINTLKDCFIQENQLEKAIQIYQCLGEIQQYKDVMEHSLALLYFQTGDIQKSLTHLKTSISQNHENYQLNLYLATAYFKEGRFQDASNHYLRCLNSQSSDYTVLTSLGMVYMKLNQVQKAQQFYQKSIKLNQNYSMSWYGYGLIHFQRNNIEQGIKCLEKAIKTDESNYPALEKLGSSYILLGEQQKGKKMFIKAQEAKKNIAEN